MLYTYLFQDIVEDWFVRVWYMWYMQAQLTLWNLAAFKKIMPKASEESV